MQTLNKNILRGVLVVALIAIVSDIIERLPFPPFTLANGSHPIESMAVGLILGILLSNLVRLPDSLIPGIKFSMRSLLSLGIILLGFKLDIHTLFKMPLLVPFVIILASLVALLSAILAGRLLKNDKATSLLIGIGNAICGSSAIMAASSSVKDATKDQIAMSISIVNLLGLMIIFALPTAAHLLGFSDLQMGLWAGATGQAVPQAIAAGFTFSQVAGIYATAIKLTRVLQIGPYVIIMKLLNSKNKQREGSTNWLKQFATYIPPFVIFFIIAIILNSYITPTFKPFMLLGNTSGFLLTMALTAIGLQTNLKALIKNGSKNLAVGMISTLSAIIVVLIACLFL